MTAAIGWWRKRRRPTPRGKIKTGPKAPFKSANTSDKRAFLIEYARASSLLDLRFLEFDVLARDRVVLLLDQLVGHGARILLGDVIEAGIRRGNELDLDGDRFGHVRTSNIWKSGAGQTGPHSRGNLASECPKSRFCRQIIA